MQRFKNIGVILSLEHSNEYALSHAKELVDTNNAQVHILCPITQNLNQNVKTKIENSLKNQVKYGFTLHFLIGKPLIEITKYVLENKLDIILVEPSKNKTLINKFFKGSLTLSLMRKTPCTIWVVKKPANSTYNRIMIAIDPEEESTAESDLNDKLIQIGTSFAKSQKAECHLVTAWTLEGESMLEGPFINTPKEEVENLKNERKTSFARSFESVQKRNGDIIKGSETFMLHGDPGNMIPEFAEEHNIDLIVMGTLARTGIQGFIIGNTAENIINQVKCSIMAVKPEGFVSPISL